MSSIEEKNSKIVYILFIIIVILSGLLLYFIFFNKNNIECEKCSEVIEEPKYQLINYSNFVFEMPVEWNFVEDYNISNSNKSIFINIKSLDEDYNSFIENEYQISFLEELQTSDNIKISSSKKEDNYYIYEGFYNDYRYLIIAIGNDTKTLLIKTQFIDEVSYRKEKKNVLDFSLSSIKKSED